MSFIFQTLSTRVSLFFTAADPLAEHLIAFLPRLTSTPSCSSGRPPPQSLPQRLKLSLHVNPLRPGKAHPTNYTLKDCGKLITNPSAWHEKAVVLD